eukprot:gene15093-16649_t
MEDEDQEETWQEFYEENRIIPPHQSRVIGDESKKQSFPFCLTLKSLEGVILPEQLSPDSAEFQVHATFYDAASHWFFGSTWKGPFIAPSDVIAGKPKSR